jgi:hypothetical protein
VILKTPVSGKMLPRASSNANSEKPSSTPVTSTPTKDNKKVIYLSGNGSGKTPSHSAKKAPQKTRQNSAKPDSADSSAKESEDDEEYEIPPPDGATTDKAKLQRCDSSDTFTNLEFRIYKFF